MKKLLAAFCFLALTPRCGAEGRFDLPNGHWQGAVDETRQKLSVDIGPRDSMTWKVDKATVTGTFKVTAVKGEYHASFDVRQVQGASDVEVGHLHVKVGDKLRLSLRYETKSLDLTGFDEQIDPRLHAVLPKAP